MSPIPASANIVLIEDDDAFRTLLAEFLTGAGHRVATADNGFDGVALLRAGPADLVLTDIEMPHGGLPTIRVMRSEQPKLPIIAMSSHHIRLNMAGALGANRTLPKPFTLDQLTGAISELISAQAQAS